MFNQASTLLPKHTHAAAPQLTSPLLNLYLPSVALLSIILILVSTSVSSTAQAATPFTTNANFSVGSDGSANYSIPIQVPPGTAGMAPTLSLNYNSNGGNGILGMGWGLDGLSQISRCPKTIIQDGAVGGVNYDVNDKFCIDGQRLISTGGTYGGNATEYRTEQANFAKITSYGAIPYSGGGNGPAYFVVKTKAGQIIEYGNSADSRIEAAAKTVVRTWGVNKISDTKGNYLTVTYTEDSTNGEAYIQRVDYTGNATSTPILTPYASVQFTYEARPDPSTGYHAGSIIKQAKRITNIKTYAPTSTANNTPSLVKDYRLTYEQGTATQRSRLKTLTECDGNTTAQNCLQLISLNWGNNADNFNVTQQWSTATFNPQHGWFSTSIHNRIYVTDVNGDGLPDIMGITDNFVGVQLNTGTGFGAMQTWSTATFNPQHGWFSTTIHDRIYVTDVNGDGLPDIMGITNNFVGVQLNTGTGFGAMQTWSTATFNPQHGWFSTSIHNRIYVTDVNGDGLPDIMGITDNFVGVQLNTGTGFGAMQTWSTATFNPQHGWFSTTIHDRIYVTDVNGDGLPDIMGITDNFVGVQLNTGTGFGAMQTWSTATFNPQHGWFSTSIHNRIYVTDVNGDGLPDIMGITDNFVGVQLNTGTGFGAMQTWSTATFNPQHGWFSTTIHDRIYVTDVNGDGLPDIMGITNNFVGVQLNTGTGFGAMQTWSTATFNPQHGWFSTSIHNRIYVTDVNGDGLPDIMGITDNFVGVQLATSVNLPTHSSVSTITPGLSSTISLTYKPITDSSIYVKDVIGAVGTSNCPMPLGNDGITTNSYPIQNVQEPVYVVSTATVSDGNGGVLTNNYNYGGLKAHLTGRGSLGFRYQKVTQVDPDINSTTFFRQDYPYIGLPCQTEKRITSSNTLVGASALTYANTPLTSANNPSQGTAISQFPYLSQSVEQNFELTGTLVNTTTTTNQYDSYGNATQISVNSGDGYIKTTVNVYNNDTTNWFLGRLLKSTVTSTAP